MGTKVVGALLALLAAARAPADVVITLGANPSDELDLQIIGEPLPVGLSLMANGQKFDFCTGVSTVPNIGTEGTNNDGLSSQAITIDGARPLQTHCDTDPAITFGGVSASVLGVVKTLVPGQPVQFAGGTLCETSVMLTWTPPTTNVDGTPYTNPAGYKLYWGTQQGNYPYTDLVQNPATTAYDVRQLCPATWFFTATAYSQGGAESSFSNVASKTITADVAPVAPTTFTMTPRAPAVVTVVLGTRLAYIGDMFDLAVPAVAGATRYEWQLQQRENNITTGITGQIVVWTSTRSGHVTPRVRACNAGGCSAWLSSVDLGWWTHYWIRPPSF